MIGPLLHLSNQDHNYGSEQNGNTRHLQTEIDHTMNSDAYDRGYRPQRRTSPKTIAGTQNHSATKQDQNAEPHCQSDGNNASVCREVQIIVMRLLDPDETRPGLIFRNREIIRAKTDAGYRMLLNKAPRRMPNLAARGPVIG